MAELRPYQRKTIDQLWLWFEYHAQGNPCIVLPTGSGKSHVIAEICRESVQSWPETRILLLTHQKELIEQDAEKLLQHWPFAPLGIYSAGIGRREMDRITFASIQSIHRRADEVGYIDLVIIDEGAPCIPQGPRHVLQPSWKPSGRPTPAACSWPYCHPRGGLGMGL